MADIWRYRFALAVLLKSPWAFGKSTRSPPQVKTNYTEAQFLAVNPLAFLRIEPAVQLGSFYALALGSLWFLRFSPQILQKTPWNFSFQIGRAHV